MSKGVSLRSLGCGAALTVLAAALAGPAMAQSNEKQSPANAGASQPAADAAAVVNPDNNAGQTTLQPQASDLAPNAGNPGEIVVTAQFRSQRLQDTPIAITAVNAATLEARGQTSVADIGAYSPNVNLSPTTSVNNNGVAAFIRGIGQSNSNFAFEPGVGIYVDDVYYGTTFGANLDLTDLDRVEVLRGPQGTLAGKNSVGGAVKLFSKKPDEQGGGFLEGTYGSYNRTDVRGSIDFKIADGLSARISGVYKHTDGYLKDLDFGCVNPNGGLPATKTGGSCVIGHEGGIDTKAARAALRYAPAGSRLEINLIGDYSDDDSQPVASKLIYANNPAVRSYVAGDPAGGVPFDSRFLTGPHSYTSYATFNNGGNYTAFGIPPFIFPDQVVPGSFDPGRKNSARNYGGSGTIDYQLADNLTLVSITAYRRASGTTVFDPDGSPLAILTENLYSRHEQFTQEVRLTGKAGTLLDYTIGGFYYDAHDKLIERIQIPNVLFDFVTNDPVVNKSESAFGHAELHLTDKLNIIGGIRYTHDDKTYTFSRRNPDGSLPSGIPLTTNFIVAGLDGRSGTYTGNHVDYRAGVNYRFDPSLMVYAQVSTGFKGGGINPTPYVADQIRPFGAERLQTFEAGFKSDLFDRLLRLNADVFYNRYRDIQGNLYYCAFSVSTTCALTTNVGNAHVKGAEAEATLRPFAGLTVNGSVGYLDFNYTSVDPLTGITKGMKAPFNSKWQASGDVEYAIDLADRGTLTPRFDVAYLSSFYYNAVNNPYNRVDGRAIANARLTYETRNRLWDISVGVTNLFNKFYYTGKNENIANYGVDTGSVGRPREASVTLRRRF